MSISRATLIAVDSKNENIADMSCSQCDSHQMHYDAKIFSGTNAMWSCTKCLIAKATKFQEHMRCPFCRWAKENQRLCFCSGRGWVRV